jgi:predicted KAP-like P-loop ATPase
MRKHLKVVRAKPGNRKVVGKLNVEEKMSTRRNISYLSDSAMRDVSLDKFNRWPFSQRVAQTIAFLSEPDSIVVGIYGVWGEGKSTVLNFIEKAFKEFTNIICVRFNPWLFKDEEQLIRNFFKTLKDAITGGLISNRDRIGKVINKYGTLLGGVSIGIPGVAIQPSEILKAAGRTISVAELSEMKDAIGRILAKENKRVVVLMDDIDRLDKTEIQAIFKLVKLSADFAYTAYILAFDEKMVAAALKEKYGNGDIEAGHKFLEKIIQVPLHLPKAEETILRNDCFNDLSDLLKLLNIEMPEKQRQDFVDNFMEGLEIRLKTPRMIKRYINNLTFSLPLLKGEVNLADLMLIEGMRTFYPKMYEVIRNNPKTFLDGPSDLPGGNSSHIEEVIKGGLEEFERDEQNAVRELLKFLFPRLDQGYGNSSWEESWAEQQRVASVQYFDRYFTYSIPKSDFSDLQLEYFLGQLEKETAENIVSKILTILKNKQSIDSFVTKLIRNAKKEVISSESSKKLILAIAKIGDFFPDIDSTLYFGTTFSRVALLVKNLLNNVPEEQGRFEIARTLILGGSSVELAGKCFSSMRTTEKEEEQQRLFSSEEEKQLEGMLASRIKKFAEGQPIYIHSPKHAPFLLYVWSRISRKETDDYLKKTFLEDPINAITFLKCYLPGGAPPYHLGEKYGDIVAIVDANAVYDALKKLYDLKAGDLQDFHHDDRDSKEYNRVLAAQFAKIYRDKAGASPTNHTD